jgi:hypothetical protein
MERALRCQAVKEAMDQIDQTTRTCSHVTQHGQTGGTIEYVCESVCQKDNSTKTKLDLVSFRLQEAVQPMENVALRTGVASMFDLAKNGKRAGNNQAAISFMSFEGLEHFRTFSDVQFLLGILETTH